MTPCAAVILVLVAVALVRPLLDNWQRESYAGLVREMGRARVAAYRMGRVTQ